MFIEYEDNKERNELKRKKKNTPLIDKLNTQRLQKKKNIIIKIDE